MPERPQFYMIKNDLTVFVRTFRPSDIHQIHAGFKKLSERSRYRRFLSPLHQLPKSNEHDLLSVDNFNRLAICAGVIQHNGWQGAGIARFTREDSNPVTAEVALTVIDKYQGLGLGSLLFELLRQKALDCGILQFTGIILADNTSMLKILNHYPIESRLVDGPAIEFKIELRTESPIEIVTCQFDHFTENHLAT